MTYSFSPSTSKLAVSLSGGIATLAIDNLPKHNALDLEMWKAIPDIMAALDRDPQVRVVIVRGAGEESFASGADIGEFATLRADAEGGRRYEATNEAAFWAVAHCAKPVIAMIRGFCQAHDEDPRLFQFLLFVQHGQLNKLPPGSPNPVDAVRAVIAQGIASGEIPEQHPDLATALVFGIVLQPVTFAAYGRLSPSLTSMCDRLIAASWAAVTTV